MSLRRLALVWGTVLAAALSLPSTASAQQYLPAASAHLASGVEGAGKDFQRARTRLRIALELRIDESPNDALVGAVLADIEPHTAVGGELRYLRLVSPRFAVSAGGIAYFVPGTLLGPCAGAELRFPVANKSYLAVGPDVNVFAIGGDLPDGIVIWQALLQVGFRLDL